MKKFFALALAAVLTLSSMTASADIRDMGIGIRADQENGVDNVFDFPHLVTKYSMYDHRMGLSTGTQDNWGGIVRKDDYIGHWGLYLDRPVQQAPWANTVFIDGHNLGIFDGSVSWDTLINGNDGANTSGWFTGLGANVWDVDFNHEILTPERNFELLKAFSAGKGTVGVKIEYGRNKQGGGTGAYTDTGEAPDNSYTTEDNYSSGMLGFGLGYGQDAMGPFNHLDLGLSYTMGSVDNSYINSRMVGGFGAGSVVMEGDGISSINFKVRAIKETSENSALHLNLGIGLDKLAVTESLVVDNNNDGDTTDGSEMQNRSAEYKNTNILFGANMNQKVNDGKGLVIVGVTALMDKSSRTQDSRYNLAGSTTVDQMPDDGEGHEGERSYTSIYANIGVETQLLSWLTFRSGIAKELYAQVKQTITEKDDISTAGNVAEDSVVVEQTYEPAENLTVTMGLGVAVKNWTLDTLISVNQFEDFINDFAPGDGVLFSDNNEWSDLFIGADLRYHFAAL